MLHICLTAQNSIFDTKSYKCLSCTHTVVVVQVILQQYVNSKYNVKAFIENYLAAKHSSYFGTWVTTEIKFSAERFIGKFQNSNLYNLEEPNY